MTTTTSLYGTCERLFADYPLAVRNMDDGVRSMTLMLDTSGDPEFFILVRWPADGGDPAKFHLAPWAGDVLAEVCVDTVAAAVPAATAVLASAVPVARASLDDVLRSAGIPVEG